MAVMDDAGIGTDIHYPYHFASVEPIRRAVTAIPELPVSRALAQSVVSLPNGTWLSDDQLERICDVLRALPPELFQPTQ